METRGLVDANGTPIVLGKELGRGGEGAVFEIKGRNAVAAKVYSKLPERSTSEKLVVMTSLATDRILKLAAWPTGILKNRNGSIVGFTMPKIAGARPVFELYGPKLRLQQFPRADWRFLIHAAGNLARAFAVVHDAGHVIGDVNHGNVVVSQDAIVRFIDTDSFQISASGKRWYCEVGVNTHQPPEMQGIASFKGVLRTPNHDNFGLAVLIFQLLCMARHPFSGRFLGSGDMPIERAIAESRFAYSSDRQRTQMLPPPGSLPMTALTRPLYLNFERAFSKQGVTGGRPTPQEWITALTDLASNLKQCTNNSAHYYLSALAECPWCEIERVSGSTLFPFVFVDKTQYADLSSLWKQAQSIADPRPLPPFPSVENQPARPSNSARRIRRSHIARKITAVVVLLGGVTAANAALPQDIQPIPILACGAAALVLFFVKFKRETETIVTEYNTVKQRWETLEKAWQAPQAPTISSLRKSLEGTKREYDNLPREYALRQKELFDTRKLQQLAQFLDRFRIAGAGIEGVGQGRIAALQSYNIETAADLTASAILQVPGFGEILAERLLSWRFRLEARFVFDPKQGVSPAALMALDRDISLKRQRLHRELANGVAQLATSCKEVQARYDFLRAQASQLLPLYSQARASMKAVGKL
jgi:DNA-binding helix-hairpin-helix protein with protein kinase domain